MDEVTTDRWGEPAAGGLRAVALLDDALPQEKECHDLQVPFNGILEGQEDFVYVLDSSWCGGSACCLRRAAPGTLWVAGRARRFAKGRQRQPGLRLRPE